MTLLEKLTARFQGLFAQRRLDREMDEEMRAHTELLIRANMEAGMSPDQARFAALRRFGSLDASKQECREGRGFEGMRHFLQDLLFGVRLWRKQPGMFALAVLALTLGLGLVTFSFSAIDCVFFGKLPFPNSDRLVYTSAAPSDFRAIQEQQSSFAALSEFGTQMASFRAVNAPSRRRVCEVGANFLDILQATPTLGRGFLPGEDKPGAEPVALIGYDLWQDEFQGSSSAIGSVIHLDGQPRTVVGVMPLGFGFPINDRLWIPVEPGSAAMTGWGFMFGRLKPGASMADARADLNVIVQRNAASVGNASLVEPRIKVGPYTRFAEMKGAYGPTPAVMAMLVVTLLVLFIACANVAGLILANAYKRATELAVRSALGATRRRLAQQMLIESLILTISGAACALLFLGWLCHWADGWMSSQAAILGDAPFWMKLKIDGRLLLALMGLIFLATMAAGLLPAIQASKRDLHDLLKTGAGSTATPGAGRFGWLLTTLQIAFSVVVLMQAILLLTFSRHLRQTPLPFDPSSILTARISLPLSVDAHSFFDQLTQSVAELSGLQFVAFSSSDFGGGSAFLPISVEGREYPQALDHPFVGAEVVSGNYFSALNVRLTQGRDFTGADVSGALPVAIVNSTFARLLLDQEHPLGQRFRQGTNTWLTVVGCVPDLKFDPSTSESEPVYFTPMSQQPGESMVVLLGGRGRASDWAKNLRAEVTRLQPDLGIDSPTTMLTLITHQIIGYYLASALLAVCGATALFLSIIGLLGLITLSVNQRKREIGIRLALGATRFRIVQEFLRRAGRQIAAGLCVGAVLAYGLNQALNHSIAGYPAPQSAVLLLVATVFFLGLFCAAAVFFPALLGARVDPMKALRYE